MIKDKAFIVKICDAVQKTSIYVLVFLMPIFFLPWTQDVLDFNKQAILVFLVIIAVFSWMARSLLFGSFKINIDKINIIIIGLFVVFLASTILSVSRYHSFWGWPQPAYQSLLSVICFCIVYFLVSNTFSEKEILNSFISLSASVFVVLVFGILQLLGVYVLGFDFSKNINFNTIGSIGALGLFSAAMLPLCIVLSIIFKKWWKVLCFANVALFFVLLLLINYNFIWWLVLTGSLATMAFWIIRRDIFDGRWIFLPTFFLIVSLFFIIFSTQTNFFHQKSLEIYLSQKASFDIGLQTLKKFPLLGSGPGTFYYDFLKFKNQNFNTNSFWNVQFNYGYSKFLTDLATVGILGSAVFLLLIFYVIYYGFRHFIFEKSNQEKTKIALILSCLAVLIVQTVGFLLYNSNISTEFLYFFFVAVLASLIFTNYKTYILKPASLSTLIITSIFTIFFIFGTGVLILEVQRYRADINYSKGVNLLQKNNINAGLQKLKKAANLSDQDVYLRQLSGAYILQLKSELKNNQMPEAQKKNVLEGLISNAINSAKKATDIGKNNVNNWMVRASVYQNLVDVVNDANTWAIKSYNEAAKLDPKNPYIFLQRGVIYYQNNDFINARADFEKATNLKPDYQLALYFLGLNYDKQNNKTKSIEIFSKLLVMDPKNESIPKILDNLKTGKPAQDGLPPQ